MADKDLVRKVVPSRSASGPGKTGFFVAIILLGLGLLPGRLAAQWALQTGLLDQEIRRGIDLIYNMDYNAADQTFDSVIRMAPEHPSGYFYRAMVFFWRMVTNPDNKSYDDSYRAWLDKAIEKSDALLDKNDRDLAGLFYKGGALGMRARVLLEVRPNPTDAISLVMGDAKNGVKYLDQISEIIPSNSDVLYGRGLFNYFIEAIKEDYPLLSPIINSFGAGSKKVGLQMLEDAAHSATYARTEAQYELVRIYYLYEKNNTAAYNYAQLLANKYPNNVVFLHFLGFAQYGMGRTDQYDSTYRVILARSRARVPGYTIRQAREAMYFLARAQMNLPRGNNDSVLYYAYNCDLLSHTIEPSEQSYYLTQSELLMGQAYDVRKDRARAVEMYKRVLQLKDYDHAHDNATQFLKTPFKK